MTTNIQFQLPPQFSTEELSHILVEITDEDFVPRARVRLGDPIALDSGVYGATATLPDGSKLSGAVHIGEGEETAVMALNQTVAVPNVSAEAFLPSGSPPSGSTESFPYASDEDASLGGVLANRIVGAVESGAAATESRVRMGQSPTSRPILFEAKLSLMQGNQWTWTTDSIPTPKVPTEWLTSEVYPVEQPNRGFVSLPVQGSEVIQSLLFLRPDRRAIVVALPLEPNSHCDVQLRQTLKDGIYPDIRFCDRNMDLLVRYAGNGLLEEARKVADTPTLLARDFIQDKEEFPVGAALGFYLLLRLGDERLSEIWTERLLTSVPWLPDGLVVHAEVLARRGRHEEAVRCLLQLPQRGLPFFSGGLSYAVERLGQYKNWVRKKQAEEIGGLAEVYTALRQISLCSDPTRPILTYQIGTKIGRDAFGTAIGRSVSLNTMPSSRPSRSVEFHAPPPSPETAQIPNSGLDWSRGFQSYGPSQLSNPNSPAPGTASRSADDPS